MVAVCRRAICLSNGSAAGPWWKLRVLVPSGPERTEFVRTFLVFWMLIGALGVMPRNVQADEPDAARDAEGRALFDAGRVAYDDGRYEDALGYFQRAFDLSGRPGLLFNIGSAAERVRNDRLALESYRKYLEALPEAPNRGFVEKRIRFLERTVAEPAEGEASSPVIPSPEQAARSVSVTSPSPSLPAGSPPRDDARGGVTGRWWFWTAIGVVAVAAAATGIVLATRGGGSGGIEPPIPGDLGPGGVVITLGERR